MGKSLKYGEFTFAKDSSKPAAGTSKSTKGISASTYDKGHSQALKAGGAAKKTAKPMKREPEAMVRKEVALLKKAGAPKAILEHEVREMSAPSAMKKGGKACAITSKMKKGGMAEAKLEKHANMPASKAHGPGAGARLKKGGVPVHSRVPKVGQMK